MKVAHSLLVATSCTPCDITPIGRGTMSYGSTFGTLSTSAIGAGLSTTLDTLQPGVLHTFTFTPMKLSGNYTAAITDGGRQIAAITMTAMQTYNLSFTPSGTSVGLTISANTATASSMQFTGWTWYSYVNEPEPVVVTICNGDVYRFGFNGKAKDNQWAGLGNHYDYGARMFDPRVARFIGIDPLAKKYPWWTPYQFAGDRPIDGIDLDGLEFRKAPGMFFDRSKFTSIETNVRAENVPYFYKVVMQVTNMDGLRKAVANTESKDQQMKGGADAAELPNIEGAGKFAAGAANILSQTDMLASMIDNDRLESAAHDETAIQTQQFAASEDLVDAAQKEDLIPKEFVGDNSFTADLTNYIFDGTQAPGSGAKGKAYNNVISTLGKELYNNREQILNGTYKRPGSGITIMNPSWHLDQPAPHIYKKSSASQDQLNKAINEYKKSNGCSNCNSINASQN